VPLGGGDQVGPDAAIAVRLEHLEVGQKRHARQKPSDLRFLGDIEAQVHIPDDPTVLPGREQHSPTLSLPDEAFGEVVALAECRRQGVEVVSARRANFKIAELQQVAHASTLGFVGADTKWFPWPKASPVPVRYVGTRRPAISVIGAGPTDVP
jgi:hypothetical protein